jgi:hypothetical protein
VKVLIFIEIKNVFNIKYAITPFEKRLDKILFKNLFKK